MENHLANTLVNLQNGDLAFKILTFGDGSYFDHVQRSNYYSLIWITGGAGRVKVDFAEYDFDRNHIFAFSPYQPFMFSGPTIRGIAIQFHSDFFCIHKEQSDIPCLFNNIYQAPNIVVTAASIDPLTLLVEQMKAEMRTVASGQYDVLVSYLKIFLVNVSRIRMSQVDTVEIESSVKGPFILKALKEAIEKDFRQKHSARDYADALNISAKALAKIAKGYFNRTLTELISERIMMEAKRELYLTHKPVKEIAYELGYEDEHYFSRFFKTNADISPQVFRDTIGFGRGSN